MRNYLGIGTCFLVVLLPWDCSKDCPEDCSKMAVPVKTPAPCQKGKLSHLSTLCVFIVTYN